MSPMRSLIACEVAFPETVATCEEMKSLIWFSITAAAEQTCIGGIDLLLNLEFKDVLDLDSYEILYF